MPPWDGEINPFGSSSLPFYFNCLALSSMMAATCSVRMRPASKQRSNVRTSDRHCSVARAISEMTTHCSNAMALVATTRKL
jgi:hypothetical protein